MMLNSGHDSFCMLPNGDEDQRQAELSLLLPEQRKENRSSISDCQFLDFNSFSVKLYSTRTICMEFQVSGNRNAMIPAMNHKLHSEERVEFLCWKSSSEGRSTE